MYIRINKKPLKEKSHESGLASTDIKAIVMSQ